MKKCLVPECDHNASCRGLCRSCYQTAFVLIKQGKTTWDQLVSFGLAGPTKGRHRGVNSLRAAFDAIEAMAGKIEFGSEGARADMEALAAGKQLPNISGCCQLYGDPQADEDDAAHVANFKRIFGEDGGAAQ